jgi:hypothetical protein
MIKKNVFEGRSNRTSIADVALHIGFQQHKKYSDIRKQDKYNK